MSASERGAAMRNDHRSGWRVTAVALLALACSTPAAAFVLTPASDDEHDAGQALNVENEIVTVELVSAAAGFDDLAGLSDDPPDTGIPCRSTPAGFSALLGR